MTTAIDRLELDRQRKFLCFHFRFSATATYAPLLNCLHPKSLILELPERSDDTELFRLLKRCSGLKTNLSKDMANFFNAAFTCISKDNGSASQRYASFVRFICPSNMVQSRLLCQQHSVDTPDMPLPSGANSRPYAIHCQRNAGQRHRLRQCPQVALRRRSVAGK